MSEYEKALDKACEELATYHVKCLADKDTHCPDIRCRECELSLHTKDQWKEYLLNEVKE